MAVKEGLLALLADGPRHGYQLKTEFESATGSVWPLNVGQVYTTLDRLERDPRCVSVDRDPPDPEDVARWTAAHQRCEPDREVADLSCLDGGSFGRATPRTNFTAAPAV